MPYQLWLLEIFFTIFSCIVLAHVSMATAIGPWIAPTLILLAQFLHRRKPEVDIEQHTRTVVLSQVAGSLGGIIAVGIGFTLPMLYFLDSQRFSELLASPLKFSVTIGIITLAAGAVGSWLAQAFAPILLANKKLTFPVSKIIIETAIQTQGGQSKSLLRGILGCWGALFVRDGIKLGSIFSLPALLPKKELFLWSSVLSKALPLSVSPTMWAMGWVAGMGIALPLFVGMLSKYIILYPLNNHATLLGFSLFAHMAEMEFSSAFCSGIILFELIFGLARYVIKSRNSSSAVSMEHIKDKFSNIILLFKSKLKFSLTTTQACLTAALAFSLLTYFGIPLLTSASIILGTAAATHQICYFGARTGFAPFGRFITLFVMIPIALIFTISNLQMTYTCVFVAVCLAVAVNLIFQYKVGELASIDKKSILQHHWIGLLLTSLTIGACFWLLLSNLQVGTSELFAHRARARALLLQSINFNPIVLVLGCIFGAIIKSLKLSPTMVFGGILMKNNLTIGLLTGALCSKLVRKPEKFRPFWTGVFAGEALWIVITLLLKNALP